MIWDAHATNQDLTSLCDDLVGTSSTTYPAEAKVRAANKSSREIWAIIHDAYGGWLYDDANQSDLPQATTQLNADQSTYALPSGADTLRTVEVHDDTSANFIKLRPITLEQIGEKGFSVDGFYETAGIPRFYRPLGTTIELFPAPSYSSAAGLKVYFDRDVVDFASAGANDREAGFASAFHWVVAYGMAVTYAQRKKLAALPAIQAEYLRGLALIKDYYAKRYTDMFPPRITVSDAVRQAE
jgi:hypothetical protein